VHVIWGMKIHPTWTTYWQAVLITFAWLFATFRFNVIVGTNYGYLNGKPPQGSALDLLGEWPSYLLAEVLIVMAGWALLTWPWTRKPAGTPLVLD
jgi:hypothetical integral membrane protein (TIGR02206 family)